MGIDHIKHIFKKFHKYRCEANSGGKWLFSVLSLGGPQRWGTELMISSQKNQQQQQQDIQMAKLFA